MLRIKRADQKTTENLKSVQLVRPERAGSVWKGVPHYDLATALLEALRSRGINVKNTQWAVTGLHDAKITGAMDIDFPEVFNVPVPEDMQYTLGVCGSNDLQIALTFYVGARHKERSYGLVTSQHVLKKKHTLNLKLGEKISEGVEAYISGCRDIVSELDRLKAIDITAAEAEHIILEASRRNIVPWSRLGKLDKQYFNPSEADIEYGLSGETAWGMYNAFSRVVMLAPAMKQLKLLNRFREYLIGEEVGDDDDGETEGIEYKDSDGEIQQDTLFD